MLMLTISVAILVIEKDLLESLWCLILHFKLLTH